MIRSWVRSTPSKCRYINSVIFSCRRSAALSAVKKIIVRYLWKKKKNVIRKKIRNCGVGESGAWFQKSLVSNIWILFICLIIDTGCCHPVPRDCCKQIILLFVAVHGVIDADVGILRATKKKKKKPIKLLRKFRTVCVNGVAQFPYTEIIFGNGPKHL